MDGSPYLPEKHEDFYINFTIVHIELSSAVAQSVYTFTFLNN